MNQHKSCLHLNCHANEKEPRNYSFSQRWSGNSFPPVSQLPQLGERVVTSRRNRHACSHVRGAGKIPGNVVTSGITVWRVEQKSVALLVYLTSCGIYYLFKCYPVSFISEGVCLNSVMHHRLLTAERLLVPLWSVWTQLLWRDAGFLHHLQQRGDRAVVFPGSRGHPVLHRTCQRSHSLCHPAGETTTTASLNAVTAVCL